MLLKIKKVYRIACIAIGKRRVNAIIGAVIIGVLFLAYQNDFNFSKTINEILQMVEKWRNTPVNWP